MLDLKTMNFNQLYKLLLEGGNAVEDVSRIEQSEILATVDNLKKEILSKLRLEKQGEDWELLGSALKKTTSSGDLDTAVNINTIFSKFKSLKRSKASNYLERLTEDCRTILNFIESVLRKSNYSFNKNIGLNIVSVAFPIANSSKKVQVDLMPTDNLAFTKWIYWSPNLSRKDSKYSGTYRTEFIIAISKFVSNENEVKDKEGKWERDRGYCKTEICQ